MRRARFLAWLVLACAAPAVAAPPAARPAAPAEARERFAWGLKLFQDGDNAGALAEFQRVYQLYPTAAVLLKVGLVYAAMGRSVEATDTLDRALATPGELDAQDLAGARAERELQARRIARLNVTSNVPATIDVDGIEVGRTPLPQPVRVVSGARVVGALAPGHLPSRREITVAGGGQADLRFELTPSEARAAHLWVRSSLPAADILVDGQRVARTPAPGSLTVAPGAHVVELRRAGYLPVARPVEVGEGAQAELTLDPAVDPAAPPLGRVVLEVSEPGAEISVDGRPAPAAAPSLALPAGEHHLRVERAGFQPMDRVVTAPAHGDARVTITLQATAATRESHQASVRARRRLGAALGLGGAVVAVAAGAFWLHDRTVAEDADGQRAAAVAARAGLDCVLFQNMASCDALDASANQAIQRRNDAQHRQDVATVVAGVGVAGVVAGAIVLLTAGDPRRYDQPDAPVALAPLLWPGGGGLAVARRF